jgi:hypothetical protein
MSHYPTDTHRSGTPPKFWSEGRQDEFLRKIAVSVRGILLGQTNNHFTVTLETAASEVAIPFTTTKIGVAVLITPANQEAANFALVNSVWSTAENGQAKVKYAGIATGTEQFHVVIIG